MTMQQRTTFAAALLILPMLTVLAMPASAQGNTQISGTAIGDTSGECPGAPMGGFTDFTIVLEGDLLGCLYTEIGSGKFTPGNGYEERGREVIEACLDLNGNGMPDGAEPCGTFETTYHFTSKWEGEPFASPQINGRCQHPIVWGSGTDDFTGASGRLDFKDDVAEGDFDWKGHIKLADGI